MQNYFQMSAYSSSKDTKFWKLNDRTILTVCKNSWNYKEWSAPPARIWWTLETSVTRVLGKPDILVLIRVGARDLGQQSIRYDSGLSLLMFTHANNELHSRTFFVLFWITKLYISLYFLDGGRGPSSLYQPQNSVPCVWSECTYPSTKYTTSEIFLAQTLKTLKHEKSTLPTL